MCIETKTTYMEVDSMITNTQLKEMAKKSDIQRFGKVTPTGDYDTYCEYRAAELGYTLRDWLTAPAVVE